MGRAFPSGRVCAKCGQASTLATVQCPSCGGLICGYCSRKVTACPNCKGTNLKEV
jgi:hypothetical protein